MLLKKWEKIFFGFELAETPTGSLAYFGSAGSKWWCFAAISYVCPFWTGRKNKRLGMQMFSWIHFEDYFREGCFFNRERISSGNNKLYIAGTGKEYRFYVCYPKTLRVPIGISAPKFAIKLGARIIGSEPELILNSSYVVPKRLLDEGFEFDFFKFGIGTDGFAPF